MSTEQDKASDLSTANAPVYLTAQEAAPLAGMSRPTLTKYLDPRPDAWYSGPRGQRWPLWLPSTLEQYKAERDGGAE